MRAVLFQFFRDTRQALRAVARMPGLAAVIIGSIAVGVGANTAVFSWIQSRIWQPIPGVAGSQRFLFIEPRGEQGSYPGMSWLEFRDLRTRLDAFDDVIVSRSVPFAAGEPDRTDRIAGLFVSSNYFDVLEMRPALGRFFTDPEGGTPLLDPVVVISHDYWKTALGGAPNVIGTTLRINDRPLTVVAVAPPEFQGTMMGITFHLWVPATIAPSLLDGTRELENRGQRSYTAIGRLRPGATKAGAQHQLEAAMRELAQAHPDTNATISAQVLASWESPRGPQRFLTGALLLLQALMLLVWLAVCGNTANLMLARASGRRQELQLRLALGAGRWRVVSLLMTESLVLALSGAALGALLAVWGTNAIRAVPMPTPGGMSIKFQTDVDLVGLAFAAALGVISAVVFGLAPALQLSRADATPAVRSGAGVQGRSRLRDVLMLVEVTLALVVLVVAGLFLKSFADTRATDPGFRREGVMLAAYDLRSRGRTVDAATSTAFTTRLLERVRALPAVESAAIAAAVPLDIHGFGSRAFALEGQVRADGERDEALTNTVTPGYLRTMAIRLVAGSDFTDLNDVATAPQAIVNAEFVTRFAAGRDPIGLRLESAGRTFTIVGVAANSLYNAYGEPPTPFIYLSYRDRPSPLGELHVRSRGGAETALMPDLRRIVRDLDATVPVYNVRTLTDHVEQNLLFRRIPARLFAVLGPLLLVLAGVGMYAVVAYTVSQRTVEIGMRLALGATSTRVSIDLLIETVRVIALGAFAGWVIAWMAARDAAGGGPIDLTIFVGVPLLLLTVAMLACWLPARRASRIDPMTALKAGTT